MHPALGSADAHDARPLDTESLRKNFPQGNPEAQKNLTNRPRRFVQPGNVNNPPLRSGLSTFLFFSGASA